MSDTNAPHNPPVEVIPSDRQRVAGLLKGLWWVLLLRGAALMILGLYAVVYPGLTAAAFAQIIGAFILIEGILTLLAALLAKIPTRGATALRGVVLVLVGLFILTNAILVAGLTTTFLLCLLAAGAIFAGVVEISAAIQMRKEIEGEGWMMLSGAISIVFGLLLLSAPLWFGLALVRIIGFFAIIAGISLVSYALKLKSLGNRLAK